MLEEPAQTSLQFTEPKANSFHTAFVATNVKAEPIDKCSDLYLDLIILKDPDYISVMTHAHFMSIKLGII